MNPKSQRWKALAASQYAWEREALELIRERLPDQEPYRAWSLFEFIADDGSVNEVDLLLLTPRGLFLVEIKSRPGLLFGDAGTWTWRFDGRERVEDNPLLLANRKAKRLRSRLERAAAKTRVRVPFVAAAIFLSATNLEVRLDADARQGIYGRDRAGAAAPPPAAATGSRAPLPGLLASLGQPTAADLADPRRRSHDAVDAVTARDLTRLLEQAGIRPSQRARRVGDFVLDTLIADVGYAQDWLAHHASLEAVVRRIRIYPTAEPPAALSRQSLQRAAEREFRLLEGLEHPGILPARGYVEHELGPALVFDHDRRSQRLDHYLRERDAKLSLDTRLALVRRIAEALRYAHGKGLYHRALSPQSILVVDPEATFPQVRLFNWQTGTREASGTTPHPSGGTPGTRHVEELADPASGAYLAPELRYEPTAPAESLDVFSLGAVAFHVLTGKPPAASFYELHELLRDGRGLSLSAALDGVASGLEYVVAEATRPDLTARFATVDDFLGYLEIAEEELSRPDPETVADPATARTGDRLAGGFDVVKRLPAGATSYVFVVRPRDRSDELVLKVARGPEQDATLRAEGEVLGRLRHARIVRLDAVVAVGERVGLLMSRAGKTLAERLHAEGRLQLELLERFGGDLLEAVVFLEEEGIPHRDLKPDNLGIDDGNKGIQHLVLFDFSLSRAPAERIHVGTPRYLDPFLSRRRPARWDLHAERFAAAVTLHQMATGVLPRWGDGQSDPALLAVEVTLEPELLDAAVRAPLAAFFARALRRDASERFDNAQEMLRDWRRCFDQAGATLPASDHDTAASRGESERLLAAATLATPAVELGLSTRALHALERAELLTVRDLLAAPPNRFLRLRGVGSKTRSELLATSRALRARFPDALEPLPTTRAPTATDAPEPPNPAELAVDALAAIVLARSPRARPGAGAHAIDLFLGVDPTADPAAWLSQSDAARAGGVTRALVGSELAKLRTRWLTEPAITALRDELVTILSLRGGVATAAELEEALLAARGADAEPAAGRRHARAVVRAAVETESSGAAPRLMVRRSDATAGQPLVALDEPPGHGDRLAAWAGELGGVADALAAADPLPSPAAVAEALLQVASPAMSPVAVSRLVRLAAATSTTAAATARLELYPRGMAAERALRLAAGTLLGSPRLPEAEVRRHVASRYPEAAPLPERPALDALLADLGLAWDPAESAYATPRLASSTLSATSLDGLQLVGAMGSGTPIAPRADDEVIAERFERRLANARGGALLGLTTSTRRYEEAARRLASRPGVSVVSVERVFLAALREAAAERRVNWQRVLLADAADASSDDRQRLRQLVVEALPRFEERLTARAAGAGPVVLLTHPGLLARHDQLAVLTRLRDRLREPATPADAAWVLLPADDQNTQPCLDGQPVPLFNWEIAAIPKPWLDRPPMQPEAT